MKTSSFLMCSAVAIFVNGCGTIQEYQSDFRDLRSACDLSEVIFVHFESEKVSISSDNGSIRWDATLVGHDSSTEISVVANLCLVPNQNLTIMAGKKHDVVTPDAPPPYFIVVGPPAYGAVTVSTVPPLLD